MRKTWLWGGALTAGVLAAALGYTTRAKSADHLDAPATIADPAADINDVYSWMDGTNMVFAMTVTPNAPAGTAFSNATQYVFHTQSGATYGATTGAEKDIIATFDATGKISVWVGTDEYVTGDASATTGLASADGKLKVFAGLRADPFFFNLAGFKYAVSQVDALEEAGAFQAIPVNDAGCPLLDTATATAVRGWLQNGADGGGGSVNFFGTFNTLALVVSVDSTLINGAGPITAVWGSTHKAP